MLCKKCNITELSPKRVAKFCYVCNHCAYLSRPKGYYQEKQKANRQRIRNELFNHYGKQCVYCGSESDLQFDHTNGDGSQTRKTDNRNDLKWFRFLIKENFPPDCQVVCRQCNLAKQQMTDSEFKAWILKLAARIQSDF